MQDKPRRGWFSLSLRTLFIAVTALCCWLGWQLSVVRERQAVLQEVKANTAFRITTASAWALQHPAGNPVESQAQIPWVRTWLGDEAIQTFSYYNWPQPTPEELARVKATFPEAEINELLAEPCHPGCFPAGTLVETPQGARNIEDLTVGDLVTTIDGRGARHSRPIQYIFVTQNRLWDVATDEGTLRTTQTQPLCVSAERVVSAGDLQPGDTILQLDDQQALRPVKVLRVLSTGRFVDVYNVVLGNSEIFVANGFLVRSKPPAVATDHLTAH